VFSLLVLGIRETSVGQDGQMAGIQRIEKDKQEGPSDMTSVKAGPCLLC
jgi:hypothetical protein